MIVEFKAERSPSKNGCFQTRAPLEMPAGRALWRPSARPITAVEKAWPYLI
jgi:hypothetical protein